MLGVAFLIKNCYAVSMVKSDKNLVHSLGENTSQKGVSYLIFFLILLGTVLLGGGAGYLASISGVKGAYSGITGNKSEGSKGVGVADKKVFPDQTEGMLREGGIEGEGSFHLERPGGESQNVYLTSSTVDLSQFLGKKIRVWGKTFQAEKAGWLMDVGYVEKL